MQTNPKVAGTTWPPGLAPRVTTLEVTITAIHDWPRHVFDFSHQGETCHCFVQSRLVTPGPLQVGDKVLVTGAWSGAIMRVFDALAVTIIR